jgi:hypothetical protein
MVSRFGPILFKQVPYTMAKFGVYEVAFVSVQSFLFPRSLFENIGKTRSSNWKAEERA